MKRLTCCFGTLKNKPEILSSIKALQLSITTVTWHCEVIAEDLTQQLWKNFADCEHFLLQLDESTDVNDTSQLCIFVRMVFYRYSCKRGAVNNTAHERTHARRAHFSVFQKLYRKNPAPSVQKLVSITTEGAPAMVGHVNGFYAKCSEDDAFPDFLNYYCIIHQQALCAKMLNMKEIMDMAMKNAFSIRARSLQRHEMA